MQYTYKNISNDSLLQKTKSLVSEERRITTEVLWCLREIEDRLLHAELGYSSLYDFAIRELGYSEGSAHRRIAATRLLKSLPIEAQKQAEEKLKEGSLSLTNVALLQGFIKTEKKVSGKSYSAEEKIELLSSLENQSKRETEKILADLQPAIVIQERERIVNQGLEISFIADEKLIAKFTQIKNLMAHRNPDPTYAELFHLMSDVMLENLNRSVKKFTQRERQSQRHDSLSSWTNESREQKSEAMTEACKSREEESENLTQVEVLEKAGWHSSRMEPESLVPLHHEDIRKDDLITKEIASTSPARSEAQSSQKESPQLNESKMIKLHTKKHFTVSNENPWPASRKIPNAIQRQVWFRDQAKCTYRHEQTARKCESQYGLEIDHVRPFSMGGSHELQNLRLRCKTHNQLHARKTA